MNLTVNGEAKTIREGMTVRDLLIEYAVGDGPVAVEVNRKIVPKSLHESLALAENDAIEIVHFVGGG